MDSDRVNDKTKDIGPVILTGLHHQFHSRMLSHYYSVWRLWAAVFRPWPDSPLLSQPGDNELPLCHHIDTELSADILSTWRFMMKNPQPHTIHYIQFSSSWVTEARHYLQLPEQYLIWVLFQIILPDTRIFKSIYEEIQIMSWFTEFNYMICQPRESGPKEISNTLMSAPLHGNL